MLRPLLLLVSLVSLAGCAGMDGVAPSELSKPTRTTSFTLANDVTGEMTSRNAFGSETRFTIGLAAGSYTSIATDEHGTYYHGPKGCVLNSASPFKKLDGGIWIPKATSPHQPMLWYYLRKIEFSNQSKPGAIEVLFNEIHVGNIKKDPSTKIEPFLLEKIHPKED